MYKECMGSFEVYNSNGRPYNISCGGTNYYGQSQLCPNCEDNESAREAHHRHLANAEADNSWLRSAGWGEM